MAPARTASAPLGGPWSRQPGQDRGPTGCRLAGRPRLRAMHHPGRLLSPILKSLKTTLDQTPNDTLRKEQLLETLKGNQLVLIFFV